MASWRKVITSGSDANLNSLTVSNTVTATSFTGSLKGTATTASYYGGSATSASYAATSSYLNPILNSYVILSQVSSSMNYKDDDEAATYGVPLGGLYRNGNLILIRVGGAAYTPTPTPAPTATPTLTPTPTPTSSPSLFSGTVNYSYQVFFVCDSPDGTFSVTGNDTTFCSSTQFTSSGFVDLYGPLHISFGANYLTVICDGTSVAVKSGNCFSC